MSITKFQTEIILLMYSLIDSLTSSEVEGHRSYSLLLLQ